MELYQHVFDTVLGIFEGDQLEAIYNWVPYRGFLNFKNLHEQYHHKQESIKEEGD